MIDWIFLFQWLIEEVKMRRGVDRVDKKYFYKKNGITIIVFEEEKVIL